ncbi:MAG: hypothetical protein IK997_05770 [Bacilli bacterium]|nr:hypothetical protein [Bacilli bacterium]
MTKKNKTKKKKEKHIVGTKELVFDIVSVLLIVSLGIYIGFRSIKYYSKETAKNKVEANTLFKSIKINNEITKGDNGLRQTKDGYYFIGSVENNYVKVFNRLYRIIDINKKGEIKIVSNSNEAVFTYGNENSYITSNVYNWLNKGENQFSGVYYNSIPGVQDLLVPTNYKLGVFENNKVLYKDKKEYKDYFTTLSVSDYVRASGTKSYLNNGSFSFLLEGDANGNPIYLTEDGTIDSASIYDGYGIRVVMTLKKNIEITGGTGTLSDPYVVNQENKVNKVNSYVKLGEDLYQTIEENDTLLKLKKTDYLSLWGTYPTVPFSNVNSEFNLYQKNNIAGYLNNTYLNNLSYSDKLSDCTFNIGEVSTDTSYSFFEIYKEQVVSKVGLLNQFDLINDNTLTDYYLINKTSSVGSMIKTYNRLGILDDDKGNESKKIVPVICIQKDLIKNGEGTKENPYVLE